MKYFLIFIALLSVFLFIRLTDKENPLLSEPIEEPFLERMEAIKPEKRPAGLPDNAVWRGEADGGNYIVLPRPLQGEVDIYYAEIYHDHTGELVYKGRFRHMHSEYSNCELIDPTKEDNNMGWGGETLHFKNKGQYLLPIDENTLDIDAYYLNGLSNTDKQKQCKLI